MLSWTVQVSVLTRSPQEIAPADVQLNYSLNKPLSSSFLKGDNSARNQSNVSKLVGLMLSRILSWSNGTGLPRWLAEDEMFPLSSTKHVHGTEVVAPGGENGAFLSPHCCAEFLPPAGKLQPWLLIPCTGHALAPSSYNRLCKEQRIGAVAAHSWLPCFLPTHHRGGTRWQGRGCTPALLLFPQLGLVQLKDSQKGI